MILKIVLNPDTFSESLFKKWKKKAIDNYYN